jgi:uncharacterized lipoprotein YajG
MMLIRRAFTGLCAVVGLAGCAFVSQNVHLAPRPQLTSLDSGHGAQVVVRVVDARPSTRIGYRGMDSKLGDIMTEEDVPGVVQKAIMDGLKAKGFSPSVFDGQPSGRILRVELRALQYTTEVNFMKGTIQTKTELQAYFRNGETLYSHLYRGEVNQAAVEAPGAKKNEALINKSLTGALEQLLEDKGLVQVMSMAAE